MEIGEAGLLQVDRRAAGEMLAGEIEEGELAELCLVRVAGVVGAGDGCGGEEIMSG
ncbi:hypothetical protein RBB78_23270 [Tunturiibacter empetritectus]|uniref:hypothetical protein n=1 Tax=Tunturiibacter empetritectus TaxID=3069691 RepID=UPI003D9BC771